MFVLAVAVGALLPMAASAHTEPTLPLTADIVEALSSCNGPAGVSIPTGTIGDFDTQPDRNNTSSSNQALLGTIEAFVIHANAEQDQKELTLDISGSHNVFDGQLDSRSHAKVGGSWNQFRHGFEYGQRSESGKVAFDLTGSNNCFEGIDPPDQPGDPDGTPDQEYENDPPVPAGFPLKNAFDPDEDGNILEHFAPGTTAANAAMADPFAGTQYFVCGIPDPDGAAGGAATAPGCSGTGASAIMDRNVQGQTLERGLYFVTGRIKISASNLSARITMVSGQQLNVNGSFQGQVQNVFQPYTDATGAIFGTLLFASQWDEAAPLSGAPDGKTFPDGDPNNDSPNTDKAEDALKIEGSRSRFEGINVATNGRLEIAGEQLDFRCPQMGDRVRVNGSKNYFNATGCVPQGDVGVVKTPDSEATFPGTINVGAAAVFNITVTNNGPTQADNVVLTDVLPSGLSWTVSGPDAGACSPASPVAGGATLTCNFGSITFPANNTRSITLTSSATTAADCARVGQGGVGEIDNNANVSASIDSNSSNNTDHGDVIVKCPDVAIVKTPDSEATFPGTINAGTNAVFNITVTNNGPGPAQNVVMTDVLPSGLLWTLSGADAASCTPDANGDGNPATYQGGTTLTCNFGTVPAPPPTGPNTRSITLTAPTTAADCLRDGGSGEIDNNAFVTALGDTATTGNNTDHGDVIVKCGAIRINKDSTKGGPVLVAGARFEITPHTTGGTPPLVVIDNGVNDLDPVTGRICVSPVFPGVLYTITETNAPAGYGLPADTTETTTPAAGGTCASGAGTVTFADPPLVDIQARFKSQVPGEASLTTPIDCNNTTGADDPADTTGWDDTLTVTGIRTVTPGTVTVTCTFVIDP